MDIDKFLLERYGYGIVENYIQNPQGGIRRKLKETLLGTLVDRTAFPRDLRRQGFIWVPEIYRNKEFANIPEKKFGMSRNRDMMKKFQDYEYLAVSTMAFWYMSYRELTNCWRRLGKDLEREVTINGKQMLDATIIAEGISLATIGANIRNTPKFLGIAFDADSGLVDRIDTVVENYGAFIRSIQ